MGNTKKTVEIKKHCFKIAVMTEEEKKKYGFGEAFYQEIISENQSVNKPEYYCCDMINNYVLSSEYLPSWELKMKRPLELKTILETLKPKNVLQASACWEIYCSEIFFNVKELMKKISFSKKFSIGYLSVTKDTYGLIMWQAQIATLMKMSKSSMSLEKIVKDILKIKLSNIPKELISEEWILLHTKNGNYKQMLEQFTIKKISLYRCIKKYGIASNGRLTDTDYIKGFIIYNEYVKRQDAVTRFIKNKIKF